MGVVVGLSLIHICFPGEEKASMDREVMGIRRDERMDRIVWGMIGCGEVTEEKNGPGLYLNANSELRAVTNRTYEKALDWSKRHNSCMVYRTVEELLSLIHISGATATDFVQSQEADGHTILFTSEVCNMWQALGIADIDCLKDLTPLMVFGGSEGVLVTQPDCPYETYEDLIAYALEHPGEVTVASACLLYTSRCV